MKQWKIRHYTLPNEQFALDEKLREGWEPFAATTVTGFQYELWLRKTFMVIAMEIEFKWFDVKSFAKEVGYSEGYVRQLIASKVINAHRAKNGRNWLIPETELDTFQRKESKD
jgi:excisionase family DNA binding protein